jgi:RNA-directed DNA polymerase
MSGDVHVRFCERLGGRFPGATRLAIFVKSKRAAERVMASINRYLEHTLEVKVNRAKSQVCLVRASAVLGFEIHPKKLRAHNYSPPPV